LGLSVLLIGGITVAINFHLTTLREQQDEIERSQVARQSLFLITKDIRAAIQYKPIETTALNELIESIQAAADLGAIAEGIGIEDETLESMGVPTGGNSGEELLESQYVATRPGIYGTSTTLQIDVSRLPRRDQYNLVVFTDGTQSDITSDVKTITYFVRNEENYEEDTSSEEVNLNETLGLVRRSLDRAVTRYTLDYGAEINMEDYEEILAQEITEIEFRYWDQENESWLTEWDSDEMMGMPAAVEISVALGVKSTDDEDAEDDRKIYRSVVYLPIAEILPPEPEALEGELTEEDSEATNGEESEGSER
ncbi:MAG: hypothetical protein VX776_11015, partial [Planctomycetota bacterium]|nr:hypothetical protein [Planctomycetota bacterium]MEC9097156.1 hypothetical protein [Planctomycetota bacterium]